MTIPAEWCSEHNWRYLLAVAEYARDQILDDALQLPDWEGFRPPTMLSLLAEGDKLWMATSLRGPAKRLDLHPDLRQYVLDLDEVRLSLTDIKQHVLIRLVLQEHGVAHKFRCGCAEVRVLDAWLHDEGDIRAAHNLTVVTVRVAIPEEVVAPCQGEPHRAWGCYHLLRRLGSTVIQPDNWPTKSGEGVPELVVTN